jgi:hypothetical protein
VVREAVVVIVVDSSIPPWNWKGDNEQEQEYEHDNDNEHAKVSPVGLRSEMLPVAYCAGSLYAQYSGRMSDPYSRIWDHPEIGYPFDRETYRKHVASGRCSRQIEIRGWEVYVKLPGRQGRRGVPKLMFYAEHSHGLVQ